MYSFVRGPQNVRSNLIRITCLLLTSSKCQPAAQIQPEKVNYSESSFIKNETGGEFKLLSTIGCTSLSSACNLLPTNERR
jgi:hypothetical protein